MSRKNVRLLSFRICVKLYIFAYNKWAQKRSLWSKKSEYQHWILHIRISSGSTFQLKLTSLIFLAKFAHKWYFRSKTKKLNSTIGFCMFELINFRSNWQFQFCGLNLPQKGYFQSETNKKTPPLNSTYLN